MFLTRQIDTRLLLLLLISALLLTLLIVTVAFSVPFSGGHLVLGTNPNAMYPGH